MADLLPPARAAARTPAETHQHSSTGAGTPAAARTKTALPSTDMRTAKRITAPRRCFLGNPPLASWHSFCIPWQ
jgi:hypothetical protein